MTDEKKYRVVYFYSATQAVNAEAESGEKAIELADEKCGVSLCHQCSRHIDLGDIYKTQAINAETDEVEVEQ